MKIMRFVLPITAALILTLGLVSFISAQAVSTHHDEQHSLWAVNSPDRYVDPGGSDAGNDCTDVSIPCASIQHAVDVATQNDNIQIAAGIYTENITIAKDVNLFGAGNMSTTVDGGGVNSVFHITGKATLSDLSVRNGYMYYNGGAGIYNEGTLVAINLVITDNFACFSCGGTNGGAGIRNLGTLTITQSIVSNNVTMDGYAGAIFNNGILIMETVSVLSNTAEMAGGVGNFGFLVIKNATIENNMTTSTATSAPGGAGIYNFSAGELEVYSSEIISNTSLYAPGGGIYNVGAMKVIASRIENNQTPGPLGGHSGGIYNTGKLVLDTSEVSNNKAESSGGGIGNFDVMTITRSIIFNNQAKNGYTGGGGIRNGGSGILMIDSSRIISNTATGEGGGISNIQAFLTITNTEISYNRSTGYWDSYGGGIYLDDPERTVKFSNISVHSNYAEYGAGIYNSFDSPDWVFIQNSLLAQNYGDNCGGTELISQGYNLDDQDTCHFNTATDQMNVDAKILSSLNGTGIPSVYSLMPDSQAIDKGDNVTCPSTDLNSHSRPVDGNYDGILVCDIGAVEYVPPVVDIFAPLTGQPNEAIGFVAKVSPITITTPITYVWQADESSIITQTNSITDVISFVWDDVGEKHISVTASNSQGVIGSAEHVTTLKYYIHIPLIQNNYPKPQPGLWDTNDAPMYFRVTDDQMFVEDFSHYMYVDGCGSVRIYITELLPINDNRFAFDGPFHGEGVFTSPTTASGMYALDEAYLGYPCYTTVSDGPYYWTAYWNDTNAQTLVGDLKITSIETKSKNYNAVIIK